jgi:hypothetical protein
MNKIQGTLLHPEYFRAPFGESARDALLDEVTDFAADVDRTAAVPMSFVVQSCRNTPDQIEGLFEDLRRQQYGAEVQPILLNAGSGIGVTSVARSYGAEVINMKREKNFRADLLNRGRKAAAHEFIFITVGHASLTNNLVLLAGAHHVSQPEVFGAYGITLPGGNASLSERIGARWLGAKSMIQSTPELIEEPGLGVLTADCAMVRKAETEGLYNPDFGAGGADGNAAAIVMEKAGLLAGAGLPHKIVREAVMSVHHTHGFSPALSLKQFFAWRRMSQARGYDPAEWDAWHPHGGL